MFGVSCRQKITVNGYISRQTNTTRVHQVMCCAALMPFKESETSAAPKQSDMGMACGGILIVMFIVY